MEVNNSKIIHKTKNFYLNYKLIGSYNFIVSVCQCSCSRKKSNKVADEQLWAVPEGGWSYIKYEVSYTEEYTYNTQTGLNEFFPREKYMAYMATGATSVPYIIMGNVQYSNGILINEWTPGDVMYDPNVWNYVVRYINYSTTYLAVNSPITAKLVFTLNCDDALVPTIAGSVDVYLATE